MKKTLFLTTVCLGLTTPFAFANSYSTEQPKEYKTSKSSESMQKSHMGQQKHGDLSVNLRQTKELEQANTLDRMIGSSVTSSDDEEIGTISDVVIDQGKIQSVIISTGGFLGMGDDLVSVPFKAVHHQASASADSDKQAFRLDVAAQDFNRAVEDGNMAIKLGKDQQGEIITSEKLAQKTTASELLDTDVNGAADKTVGTLKHLSYDQDGSISKAYLTADDVDGLDEQLVEIPFEQLQLVQRSNRELQLHLPAPEAQYDDSVRRSLASSKSMRGEADREQSSYERERLMGTPTSQDRIEEAQNRQMADARQRAYQADNQQAERMQQPRVETMDRPRNQQDYNRPNHMESASVRGYEGENRMSDSSSQQAYDRRDQTADARDSRDNAYRSGTKSSKDQQKLEQARLEEELKLVIASFKSDNDKQAQVRLQTEEGTIVLRGEVASEDLKEHIESNFRKLTDAEIRNELKVNSKLAANR